MYKITNRYGCVFRFAFAGFGVFWLNSAQAQITPDQTLPNNSTVTQQDNINRIEGGTTAGSNLFHSFTRFDIPTDTEAHFKNATDIQNILTRVTGGSISNIHGLIKANGRANLFLINPNGFIFGENAKLDIGGSFITTTADSILFGNGIEFNAVNPQDKPLLTVNLPLGLQYGQNPGGITVKGNGEQRNTIEAFDPKSGLKVLTDKTLALLGGNVLLEGAVLKAGSGRIELGSVASEGKVNIEPVENGFAFGFNEFKKENFGNIQALKNTAVDASGDGAGDIRVTGKNLTINNNSVISSAQTGTAKSGEIIVDNTEKNEIDGTSDGQSFVSGLYANNFKKNEVSEAANIKIQTPILTLLNGARITNNAWEAGNGGDINIDVEDLQVIGTRNNVNRPSELSVTVKENATGNGGNLTIKTDNLLVKDGAFISVNTSGQGDGGNMAIDANSTVAITGKGGDKNQFPSGLFIVAEKNSSVNSGSLTINTERMLVENSGFVDVTNNGKGSAGSLNIKAKNELLLKNNVRFFVGRVTENQNVGDLTIETNTLLVEDGSSMRAGTSGVGGSLNITAKDIQVIGTGNDGNTPSSLTVSAKRGQTLDGGQLNIETERIRIENGAYLSTGPSGKGKGGDLNINAAEYVYIIGQGGNNPKINNQPYPSGLFASAEKGSDGDAGNVNIETKEMLIKDGAIVSTSTDTQGNGGNLKIKTDSLQIQNESSLNSATLKNDGNSAGKGGNLTLFYHSRQRKNGNPNNLAD